MCFSGQFPLTNGLSSRCTVCHIHFVVPIRLTKRSSNKELVWPLIWQHLLLWGNAVGFLSKKNAKFPQVSNNQRQITSQFSFKKKIAIYLNWLFWAKHHFVFIILPRYLPREVDPLVYNMSHEDPGNISYSEVGGLSEQIRELREVPL